MELSSSEDQLDEVVITILGITFKENVPDIRNTRVIDIINELRNHSVTIQVYDPCAEIHDVKNEYQIDLKDYKSLQRADVVIVAVPHDEFIDKGWSGISALLHPSGGIVFDVKSILDRCNKPNNIELYRL